MSSETEYLNIKIVNKKKIITRNNVIAIIDFYFDLRDERKPNIT